jgi:hypothetical protein
VVGVVRGARAIGPPMSVVTISVAVAVLGTLALGIWAFCSLVKAVVEIFTWRR